MIKNTEHSMEINAPAGAVHKIIANVTAWPQVFKPTVHVEYLEQKGNEERIQIWAQANGETKAWVSKRVIRDLSITFRQEVSAPPVRSMGGEWIVEPLGSDTCRVRLLHDFTAADDQIGWVEEAVHTNSVSELTGLREIAERASQGELRLSFEDTISIAGSAKDAYDFVNEADRWAERLPHVASVSLREDMPGVQLLLMETRAADGSTHTTESVRICRPSSGIYYKQLKLPALLSMHVGYWRFEEVDDGLTRVTAGHAVEIREDAIRQVLGPAAGIADARDYLRSVLGGNSKATLAHAKKYAEQHA